MFRFLFKRNRAEGKPVEQMPAQPAAPAPSHALTLAPVPVPHKQAALERASALASEASAVEFILDCEFADARLKAAEHVQSPAVMEQVRQKMLNTDRRLAKLMQTRLDNLRQLEAQKQKTAACIEQAHHLLKEPLLLPSQAADLDHKWQSLGAVSDPQQSEFDHVHAQLSRRLQEQAELQRMVLDTLGKLRNLEETLAGVPLEEAARTLARLEGEMTQHLAATEAPSLPKHLPVEFTRLRDRIGGMSETAELHRRAATAREEALARWEISDSASLTKEMLSKTWRALPQLDNPDMLAPLQARFDALVARIAKLPPQTKEIPAPAKDKPEVRQHFNDALELLENALRDGVLQTALEQDKLIRSMEGDITNLPSRQVDRLHAARGELGRLQGWARWGGNVSREELLKSAEELPAQTLPTAELGKRIGDLRARWKALDQSSGAAPKELWLRFDAACTAAHAPVAAHHQKLAEERTANLGKASALIAELRQHAAGIETTESASVDWKALAAHCLRNEQAWRRLGPIDRKEKKRVDAEFKAVLETLSAPLASQRHIEIKRREKLISEATALHAEDRNVFDSLRQLQERWQEQAKALPLERNEEQALWLRFRHACDDVVAKRKEIAHSEDNDRHRNLEAKQALCVALEEATDAPEAVISKLLRDTREAWEQVGSVPRASENQVNARYKAAVEMLRQRLDAHQLAASRLKLDTLRSKWRLCKSIEEALSDLSKQPADLASLQQEWQDLPALSTEDEQALKQRFNQALQTAESGPTGHLDTLKGNGPVLSRALLRLEILAGVDSPPHLMRERLALQVEVLQSSLKEGHKQAAPQTRFKQLAQLCALPALTDAQVNERIEHLFRTCHELDPEPRNSR